MDRRPHSDLKFVFTVGVDRQPITALPAYFEKSLGGPRRFYQSEHGPECRDILRRKVSGQCLNAFFADVPVDKNPEGILKHRSNDVYIVSRWKGSISAWRFSMSLSRFTRRSPNDRWLSLPCPD